MQHFPNPGLFTKEPSYFTENSHWNHRAAREKVPEDWHSTAVTGAAGTDQAFPASTSSWLQLQLLLTVVDFLAENSSLHCEVNIDNILESERVGNSGNYLKFPGISP